MKLKIFANITIFIAITLSIGFFLRYDIYEHDDFNQAFIYILDLWEILKMADHGRYFSWLYMKLTVHGSSWIQGIHPNSDLFPKFVTGFNIAILSMLISRFITFPYHKKLSPVWFLSTFFIILGIYTISLTNIYRYNQHFAYQSNLIWFFLGWGTIVYYFTNGIIPPSKDLLKNSFLAFMLGVTAHFNTIASIGAIGILLIYGIICFGKKTSWKINSIFSCFFRLGRGIAIPLIFFIIGSILYFSAPHFKELLAVRAPAEEGNRILQALMLLPEFIPQWGMIVFINMSSWIFMSAMILTSILILRSKSSHHKRIKIIIIAWSIVWGAAFFNASLILSGKSFYGTDQFWLVHSDLKVVTRMMFLAALWILIGYFLTLVSSKINFIISSGILLYSSYTFYSNIPIYEKLYDSLKKARSNWYMTEKLYRFYSLHQQTAVLPANSYADQRFFHEQLYWSDQNHPMNWPGTTFVKLNYPAIYYKDLRILKDKNYHEAYNKNSIYYVPYILTNKTIALQQYSNMGGILTKEELNNPDFNKLFDTNFILNKNSEIKNN